MMRPSSFPVACEHVRRRVGSPTQLVRVDRAELTEGPGAGSPVLIVRNPEGISFEVLLDRAMDIGWADALNMPLAWSAQRGRVASTRYDAAGANWTRTFGGGLITTCGLASTGMPSTVDGSEYGLHGRIGHTPAENVTWRFGADDSGPLIEITGDVIEAALGEPTLRLTRTIRAWCDRPVIEMHDVVTNDGFVDAGHMYRHHINLGYPLIDAGSSVSTDAVALARRGGGAADPLHTMRMDVAEQVVDESVTYARSGPTGALTLTAPHRGVAFAIEWTADTFPLLLAWRDPSPGINVLGIEPSTSRDEGRAEARQTGELITLAPGETRTYRTRMSLLPIVAHADPNIDDV
ncbi:DUF4432 family protein [Mycetocola sp.]|uniref:DUF4432 family protein n=1 Tax=Mycetocola sp. TaxID=1871042 RepID=UPI00260CD845|nr:DUF4432 family protein [Mycetocola sp.]MCU1419065.1 hypothetical protein [Mycetocola sp.]MCU1561197.1 hypothetical protein [Mycetocola sp.]